MALGATVAMLLVLLPLGVAAAAAAAATGAGSSNCTRICGNISIPYPFGVESGCYHAGAGGGFNLTCNHSFHPAPPELFLGDGTVQVLDISIQHSTVRINSTGVELSYFHDPNYGQNATRTWGAGLPRDGPYYLSESTNMLQAIGCDIQVSILGGENNSSLSSCTALCPTLDLAHLRTVGNKSCSGIACCQASIVLGLSLYTIQINTLDSSPIIGTAPSVYIVDQTYHYDWGLFYGEGRPHALPATLNWVVNNSRCPTITAPECRSTNSYCQDFIAEAHGGYMCKCSQGYQGNPYIPGGCQDIDECKYPDTYICYGQCKNTPGSFICQCNTGYTGNSSHPNGCKEGKLTDILDPQVMEEEDGEIQEIASLAAMCTKLKCEDRPTMREVEMTLESLLVKKRKVPLNGTRPTNSGETATPYMPTGRGTKEVSRQYTMEEEILLSASFPR